MTDVAELVRNSPIDYSTAVGYALHQTMRWLVITYIVGVVFLSSGLSLMAGFSGPIPVTDVVGLVLVVVGATMAVGGGVGAAFKVIVDGVTIAAELTDGTSTD